MMFGLEVVKGAIVQTSTLTVNIYPPHPQQHTSAVTVHTAVSYRIGDRELTASRVGWHRHTGRGGSSSSDTSITHLH